MSPRTGRPHTPRKKPRPAHSRRRQRVGKLFEDLVALQARLRSPNGCPWDREQTHESLRTYLLEETYEVLEALDSGEDSKLAAELGDLLLQIVFHAELACEAGRFDIGEVIERIHAKMVRRHPHVFGEAKAKSSAEVLKHWEQLKAEERRARTEALDTDRAARSATREHSLLDGIPKTLPAVLEAYQLTRRAARIGFDWDDLGGLLRKLLEESEELREALGRSDPAQIEQEAGDLLFVAVNVARFLDLDPEIALQKANRKFATRFREMEQQAARRGRRLTDVSRADLEALWDATKGKRAKVAASVEGTTMSSDRK